MCIGARTHAHARAKHAQVKTTLHELIIFPLAHPELFQKGVRAATEYNRAQQNI